KNYKIIKYEDLVRNTEDTMISVSQFAGIPYDKKMIKPTRMGEMWSGNSTSDEEFKGVSDERLDVWRTGIYPFEVSIVNKLFPHILKRFGYKYIKTNVKKYYPCRGENIRNYILNRIFLANAEKMV